jgi:hypothetical protein
VSPSATKWFNLGYNSCCGLEVGGGDIGGGLADDFTLDVRLRFGGRAGGCPGVSFGEELAPSVLKQIHVHLIVVHVLTVGTIAKPSATGHARQTFVYKLKQKV